MDTPLLRVEGLSVTFRTPEGETVRAVRSVSFDLRAGETLALVGESGSGKSVTALALARLLPPNAEWRSGDVLVEGRSVCAMNARELRALRGGTIGYIFQEPGGSLNPVLTAGEQIAEALRAHHRMSRAEARAEGIRLMRQVGLPDPDRCWRAWPHELSGGMQQRVMIAMALACQPKLLVADEPTTALDVTIQAQILELLTRLQEELGMAILLITHNLALVAHIAQRVLVMYAGQIVETGPTREILAQPRHPYTRMLMRAVPRLCGPAAGGSNGGGAIPNRAEPSISGCVFYRRCPLAVPACAERGPAEEEEGERTVRCFYWK